MGMHVAAAALAVLSNAEALAVHQDAYGTQARARPCWRMPPARHIARRWHAVEMARRGAYFRSRRQTRRSQRRSTRRCARSAQLGLVTLRSACASGLYRP
jgi:hypothetical protein